MMPLKGLGWAPTPLDPQTTVEHEKLKQLSEAIKKQFPAVWRRVYYRVNLGHLADPEDRHRPINLYSVAIYQADPQVKGQSHEVVHQSHWGISPKLAVDNAIKTVNKEIEERPNNNTESTSKTQPERNESQWIFQLTLNAECELESSSGVPTESYGGSELQAQFCEIIKTCAWLTKIEHDDLMLTMASYENAEKKDGEDGNSKTFRLWVGKKPAADVTSLPYVKSAQQRAREEQEGGVLLAPCCPVVSGPIAESYAGAVMEFFLDLQKYSMKRMLGLERYVRELPGVSTADRNSDGAVVPKSDWEEWLMGQVHGKDRIEFSRFALEKLEHHWPPM